MALASHEKLHVCQPDNSQNTTCIDNEIGLEVNGGNISLGIENQKHSSTQMPQNGTSPKIA